MAKKRPLASAAAVPSEEASTAQRIVADYLTELRAIRTTGAGVPETSYYPALSNLLNAVGKTLKPKVRCIISLSDQGSGLPDGGLFTADQFQRQADGAPRAGQLPARGAIEAKGTRPGVEAIADTQQVKDYLATYGIVLVTNLREFLIVERGPTAEPAAREGFALADSEQDFWKHKAAHPRATAQLLGEPFIEFLKRACLHAAPLLNPKDVAWFLASYARDALFRVERHKELPALNAVRAALEEALGMQFTAEKGEHFFRSTLVQTLFYGVFSAWVRWHKDNPAPGAKFDWRTAEWSLHVPFIRTLYEEVAKPSQLGPLGLVEVLDWSASVLNRVDRAAFFRGFEEQHAVQYFYEPFLEAYDPELRKALGVWYTPPEIVRYQVARVDRVLREELDLPDGLADPNVVVLDPCCGTGAYLVEVLQSIAATLRDKGGDALVASDLKQAAMERVFGFEIMPAPFVVAHLQLGLMLQAEGAPLSLRRCDRVGVYLTNALTGWEPPKGSKQRVMTWAELQEERDAAEQIKREQKILVVLGNPPYNAFAGVSPQEEQGLVEPYKANLNRRVRDGGWGIRKFNLDDLYIRFFRLAERRIAEMSGRGVISFVSNFSYLSDPSFVVMRQRFLTEFDKLWFDCLNGDSRETGKLTPDGDPDPSVFSTEYNREGIRVGTAICVVVRKHNRSKSRMVYFRNFWGVNKRSDLVRTLALSNPNRGYSLAHPTVHNRLSFRPESVSESYVTWPSVVSFCATEPISGLQEMRREALIDISRDDLHERIKVYLDASLEWSEAAPQIGGLAMPAGAFDPRTARARLLRTESLDASRIVRYSLYPFDNRWCYRCETPQLWNRPRPKLAAQLWGGNRVFVTRPFAERPHEWASMTVTPLLPDYHLLRPNAVAIPIRLKNGDRLSRRQHATLFDVLGEVPSGDSPTANLSKRARAFLAALGIHDPDKNAATAGLVWMHALAIGYSPAYLTENADGIRRDWPRIPLPNSRAALEASAALGERIAALLDTEAGVPGVTSGKLAPALRTIGVVAKVGGGAIDPDGNDLAVTARWGHFGKKGVVMPGKGRVVERPYTADETAALTAEGAARELSVEQVRKLLGEHTTDVYLNGAVYWRNVPRNVWEYHVGGYQVIKKWLSYREQGILGRALQPDEAREVMNMARRIAAILLLELQLDANYRAVAGATYNWPQQT